MWGRWSLRNTLSKTLIHKDPTIINRMIWDDKIQIQSVRRIRKTATRREVFIGLFIKLIFLGRHRRFDWRWRRIGRRDGGCPSIP